MLIRIRTKDAFGNIYYIYNDTGGAWSAALSNGIPYNLRQAARTEDEMALRFALEKATDPEMAVAILKKHSTRPSVEFEIVT